MPIELIDKIKPKNDGDFKLVDYEDVDGIEELEIEETSVSDIILANPEFLEDEKPEILKTLQIENVKYKIVPEKAEKAIYAEALESTTSNIVNLWVKEIFEEDSEEEGNITGRVKKAIDSENSINAVNLKADGTINGVSLKNIFEVDDSNNLSLKIKESTISDFSKKMKVYKTKPNIKLELGPQTICLIPSNLFIGGETFRIVLSFKVGTIYHYDFSMNYYIPKDDDNTIFLSHHFTILYRHNTEETYADLSCEVNSYGELTINLHKNNITSNEGIVIQEVFLEPLDVINF